MILATTPATGGEIALAIVQMLGLCVVVLFAHYALFKGIAWFMDKLFNRGWGDLP